MIVFLILVIILAYFGKVLPGVRMIAHTLGEYYDELGHLILFGMASYFLWRATDRLMWRGLPLAPVIISSFALIEELFQLLSSSRTFDLGDLSTGLIGIWITYVVDVIISKHTAIKKLPNLLLLSDDFTLIQYSHDADMPSYTKDAEFLYTGRTDEELSLMMKTMDVPSDNEALIIENGYRCIKIDGVLELSMVGVLSGISRVLKDAKVPIFCISTYNTDYIFINNDKIAKTMKTLTKMGYKLVDKINIGC